MAKLLGTGGVQRFRLLNQSWSYEGVDSNGKKIDSKRYEDRVVMVVFYELASPENARLFSSMSALYKVIFGRSVDFICVGIDTGKYSSEAQNIVPAPFQALETDLSSPNSYLTQCPTRRFPYAILINKQGIVDSINVTLSTVKTRIEYLLSTN